MACCNKPLFLVQRVYRTDEWHPLPSLWGKILQFLASCNNAASESEPTSLSSRTSHSRSATISST